MGKKITITKNQFQDDIGEEMLEFNRKIDSITEEAGEELLGKVTAVMYGEVDTILCTLQGAPTVFVNMMGSMLLNYANNMGIPTSVLLASIGEVVEHKKEYPEKFKGEEISY